MDEVRIINCASYEESINTLSVIYGIDKEKILTELNALDIESIFKNAEYGWPLHYYMCEKFGIKPILINKIHWFHFSKTLCPALYCKIGILPTNLILPVLMRTCYNIIENKSNKRRKSKTKRIRKKLNQKIWSRRKWRKIWYFAFKDLDFNDRCRFDARVQDLGPNGMLIKEVGLHPKGGTGHFYECPEIVRGLLAAIDRRYHTNILDKFIEKGQSCVVTFTTQLDRDIKHIAEPILTYVFKKIRGNELGPECNTNYNAKNTTIGTKDILNVESIEMIDGKAMLKT
ncbi:hypothetical protein ACUZ9P_05210 [Desulfovibrio sp. QI0430]